MTRNRVGLGFDVHPFGDAPPLVLGGVSIADAPRLAGHSDGDAVAHAVADAILGPSGLPDLGTLFPATDEQYRDADSMRLLAEVARRVARLARVCALRPSGWRSRLGRHRQRTAWRTTALPCASRPHLRVLHRSRGWWRRDR